MPSQTWTAPRLSMGRWAFFFLSGVLSPMVLVGRNDPFSGAFFLLLSLGLVALRLRHSASSLWWLVLAVIPLFVTGQVKTSHDGPGQNQPP